MAVLNQVGNSLTGSTGTGQFVGDTSPTIVTPQINDANGNEVATFTGVASAVDYLTITNAAATTHAPEIGVAGAAADIGINLVPKGVGGIFIGATATSPSKTYYSELTGNGSNRVEVKASDSMASDQSVVWKSASSGYPALDTVDGDEWTAFTPTFTGFSAVPSTILAFYKKIGKTCFINIASNQGTSNATTFTITGLPFAADHGVWTPFSFAYDNSGNSICVGSINAASTTLTLYHTTGSLANGWTAANGKGINMQFTYETA